MDDNPKVNNVIVFPVASKNRPPQSLEEICKNVELVKTTRIEEVTEEIIIDIFEELYAHHYDFTERHDANKDMAFLIEALKSVMHKHDGLHHPFHDLADEYFSENEQGDLTFIEVIKVEEDLQ